MCPLNKIEIKQNGDRDKIVFISIYFFVSNYIEVYIMNESFDILYINYLLLSIIYKYPKDISQYNILLIDRLYK